MWTDRAHGRNQAGAIHQRWSAPTRSPQLDRGRARLPQRSEPMLLPKVRIHLADFPYPHSPVGQRLLAQETWGGCRYVGAPDAADRYGFSVAQGKPVHRLRTSRASNAGSTPPPGDRVRGGPPHLLGHHTQWRLILQGDTTERPDASPGVPATALSQGPSGAACLNSCRLLLHRSGVPPRDVLRAGRAIPFPEAANHR